MNPSIRATRLCKSFTNGRTVNAVIHELSFDIRPGQLTLITGPSGCGKSTLLALLSGLTKPDRGEVFVLGESLWQKTNQQIDVFRLANCGFVFQGFHLFAALTALQQVMLPIEYMGSRNARSEAMRALELVGLAEKAHLRPRELSGGENQRVAIARAMAKKPELVFADEPTSALDSANGEIVTRLLHQIAHEQNATIVCVTHDPRVIKHADRVIGMEDGRIVSDSECEMKGWVDDRKSHVHLLR